MRRPFVAFVCCALALSCASGPRRTETAAPASPPADSHPPSIESIRSQMRDSFCAKGGIVRECYAVPDEASCFGAFDAAWPECTKGIVLHVGPSEEDREAGRRSGECLSAAFAAKYARVESDACLRAAGALGGRGAKEQAERTSQCNRLIHKVNEATDGITSASKDMGGGRASDFFRMARALEAAAAVVASAELQDKSLIELRAQYVAVIKRMADAMRDTGEALDRQDDEGRAHAKSEFGRADADEDVVRAAITRYCATK